MTIREHPLRILAKAVSLGVALALLFRLIGRDQAFWPTLAICVICSTLMWGGLQPSEWLV